MPYKDPEKNREYQRQWLRNKLANDEVREKHREARALWRKKNRDAIREYAKTWQKTEPGKASVKRGKGSRRQEAKDWLENLKKTLSCEICGESHPATLDFHHKDPSTKKYTVCRMVRIAVSLDVIREEIAKCTVLCANCHRIHHWKMKKSE